MYSENQNRSVNSFPAESTLEATPHPDVSRTSANAMALDNGMRDCKAKIKIQSDLQYYPLKRLRLNTNLAARTMQDPQLVLLHREVFHADH